MKQIIGFTVIAVIVFLAIFVITKCSLTGQERKNPKEGIPVIAYFGVQIHTVERYHEFKECGFDYNYSKFDNIEDLARAMDAAKEAGVGLIAHSWDTWMEKPEVLANRFKDHPGLAGYYLKDEPQSSEFPRLGDFARRIRAVDKDERHFFYLNLFPTGVPEYVFAPATTYRGHVQLLIDTVPVQFLSFDHYPIRADTSGVRSLSGSWYENLEIISDEARKAGIPFWAFALATTHWSYPIPTIADLRLQVYSNLAYGAQGIQYFSYWTPPLPEAGDMHDGPVLYDGTITETWNTVQAMNREIKALSGVFLGAQVIKVEHISTDDQGVDVNIPNGTTRFDFANRPAEAKIIKTFTTTGETNAVVSFLKNGKRCYMVVVNRNVEGGNRMTVKIEGGKGLQLIKKDGTAVPVSSKNSSQSVTPGDVIIYGWDH